MDNGGQTVRHICCKLYSVLSVGYELLDILGTVAKDLSVSLTPILNYKNLKKLLTKKFKSSGLFINPGLVTNDANQQIKVNNASTAIKKIVVVYVQKGNKNSKSSANTVSKTTTKVTARNIEFSLFLSGAPTIKQSRCDLCLKAFTTSSLKL